MNTKCSASLKNTQHYNKPNTLIHGTLATALRMSCRPHREKRFLNSMSILSIILFCIMFLHYICILSSLHLNCTVKHFMNNVMLNTNRMIWKSQAKNKQLSELQKYLKVKLEDVENARRQFLSAVGKYRNRK